MSAAHTPNTGPVSPPQSSKGPVPMLAGLHLPEPSPPIGGSGFVAIQTLPGGAYRAQGMILAPAPDLGGAGSRWRFAKWNSRVSDWRKVVSA